MRKRIFVIRHGNTKMYIQHRFVQYELASNHTKGAYAINFQNEMLFVIFLNTDLGTTSKQLLVNTYLRDTVKLLSLC